MSNTIAQTINETQRAGFELAIKYLELAVEYQKDPVLYLKEKLNEMEASNG